MNWYDDIFERTVNMDEDSYNYTLIAESRFQKVIYADAFLDVDARTIYEGLCNDLRLVSFCDYLKRYVYTKAGLTVPFSQVTLQDYKAIILASFKENRTPPAFRTTSAKLGSLINGWLKQESVSRETVFLLGFGLRMTPGDVSVFLTKALREQDFNFKDPFEMICWYCLKNQYRAAAAIRFREEYEALPPVNQEVIHPDAGTVFMKDVAMSMNTDQDLRRSLQILKGQHRRYIFSTTAFREFQHLYSKARERLYAEMKERPEERLVNTVALRCMRQAVYQTENVGHFGLAAEYYCHFTSPIRRYPDLLGHRILHAWLKDPDLTRHLPALGEDGLEAMAEHSSLQERNAAEAERETVDLKKAEYMLDHIGETFEGVISGVASFGMFVELPNGVEGLVHMSSLMDDYYEYVEDRYCLTGTHTGNTYRLGDTVEIEVLQVNMEDRSIDFIMAGENDAMRDYIKTQLGSRGGNRSAATGSGAAHHSGNGKKIDGRGANSGGAHAKNNYRAGHSSVSALLAEIRQDAAQATGSGRKKNKRRHGSHEQVNGRARTYAKRGKGGIGGNKYAGSTNKKKRRR